jgi:hypothetical protein
MTVTAGARAIGRALCMVQLNAPAGPGKGW